MSVKELESELHALLNDFFATRDFVLKPTLKQYRRETSAGFQNFILSFSKSQQEFYLDVNIGVRIEHIEQIAQQFLETLPAFQLETNTLIVSVGKLNNNKYFRYRIGTADDLPLVSEQVKEFVTQQGLPFVEQYASLKRVDGALNKHPETPCKYLYNQTHRYFKGLVAAKLAHNPKFAELADFYFARLEAMKTSEDRMNQFVSMTNFLTYYSEN